MSNCACMGRNSPAANFKFTKYNSMQRTWYYQLAPTADVKESAHSLVPSAVGCLVVVVGCVALVAEDTAAVGDRHIGGHGAVRAPVVAVRVIADADGRLQASMAFCNHHPLHPSLLQSKPHAGNPFWHQHHWNHLQIQERGRQTQAKNTYLVKAMLMMAVSSFVAAVSLVLLIFVLNIPARSGFKPVDLCR